MANKPLGDRTDDKRIVDKILTEKRMQILNYINDYVKSNGYPPSVREIAKHVNLSSASSVHSHLNTLVNNGYLVRDPSKPRAIKVNFGPNLQFQETGDADPVKSEETLSSGELTSGQSFLNISELNTTPIRGLLNIPILGSVAAGTGVIAEQNIEEYINLPKDVVGSGQMFGLHVRGNSMINAGILNKDLVIARSQNAANAGEIVVASINDDEATVKYYFRENKNVILKPANTDYEPIVLDQQHVTIFGKVVTVIRSLA
jgi:repressor LexA